MDSNLQLISDGDGLAVIGDPTAVERFLVSEGLPSRDLGLSRLGSAFSATAGAAQAGSEIAANSGRWVKLTKESAQALSKHGLMKGRTAGTSRAVVTDNGGKIKGILELVRTPGAMLSNPALLAGAAGLMAQLAMQQTMDEITDYLAAIDEKVDDVLRAQKDSVLADMIGAGFVIEEALTVRDQVGRVSDITWSKVSLTTVTIASTQAAALLRLDALAEKLEQKTKIGDLAKTSKDAEATVRDWLAVLARCFQLQDAIAVLELDRVLDTSPDELDLHRLAIRTARQNRVDLIARCTERLMARIAAAVDAANTKVLLHPTASPAVVNSGNQVATAVIDFRGHLGIERDRQSLDVRRWVDAATEARNRMLESGAEGVDAAKRIGAEGVDTAKRIGAETFDRAKSVTGKLSNGLAGRVLRRRGDDAGEAKKL